MKQILFFSLFYIWVNWGSQLLFSHQSCPTLCNPMDCSTPRFPVFHHLPEFAQIHVYSVSDAIQPSHPLSSPSPPAFNLSQHQGLFQWVGSSHQVAKVLELQHQPFQWIFRVISGLTDCFDHLRFTEIHRGYRSQVTLLISTNSELKSSFVWCQNPSSQPAWLVNPKWQPLWYTLEVHRWLSWCLCQHGAQHLGKETNTSINVLRIM